MSEPPKIEMLIQRIGAKLFERNLSEREASIDATGKPDALRYIRTRKAMPSSDRLERIAATLGTTSNWLLGGDDLSSSPGPELPTLSDLRKLPRNLPIYGTALAADIEFFTVDGFPMAVEQTVANMADPTDYMPRPTALAGKSHMYVIVVSGHSMEPRFDAGRRVLVDGKRPPRIGDDVIIQLRAPIDDGEEVSAVLIKQLVRQKAGTVILRQFNPATDFEIATSQIVHIHTVLPWEDVLGF